jgi:2'-5' RNA ligase
MVASERPWRLFVAVPIGRDLREAVEACARAVRARPGADAWRWTDAEGWHVTLAFLGATDPSAVSDLSERLCRVAAKYEPFQLETGGLGAFPSRRRARVLWYAIADPRGELRRLAEAVQAASGSSGEDRFRGHLTLARARERFGTDATDLLDGSDCTAEARLLVERLVLYRSHLGRGPARYEELSSALLRG